MRARASAGAWATVWIVARISSVVIRAPVRFFRMCRCAWVCPSTCAFSDPSCVACPHCVRLAVGSKVLCLVFRTHGSFVVLDACFFSSLPLLSFRFRHVQQCRHLLFGLDVFFRTGVSRTFQRIDGFVHTSLCQPRRALSKVSIGLFRPSHVHVHVPFAGLLHPRRTCRTIRRRTRTSLRLPTSHVSFRSRHRRFGVVVLGVPRFHAPPRDARARRTSNEDGARVAQQAACVSPRRKSAACDARRNVDARGDVGAVLESQRCDGCQAATAARGMVDGTRCTSPRCDEREDEDVRTPTRRGRAAWCEDPSAVFDA